MAPTPTSTAVKDELRQLFARGDHEALLIRTDNLQKRKRLDDPSTKQYVDLLRALSLIHLGRPVEAIPLLDNIPSSADASVTHSALFAKLYAAWASNDGVDTALANADTLSGDDASRLKAQLLYRCGRYSEAAEIYLTLFQAAKTTLDNKRRPAAVSRWRIMSREPVAAPVTVAELEQLAASVNELATNAMASLVLAGRSDDALELKRDLRASYELEYNAACAQLARAQPAEAELSLQHADTLVRAELDDDDDDIEEVVAPVTVQMAYVRHLAGEVANAERVYSHTVDERKADAASIAVAANNLTVALGQLAFRDATVTREDGDDHGRGLLPKEQHDALVEGLKKMRATAGKAVERKLTTSQRRAMARNRAILLVQMGRQDACRAELNKLKSEFPDDELVPLIEASLIARHSSPETADRVLALAGNSDEVRAARVQLASAYGDKKRAADLLQELFPGKPAAVVTAAQLLEETGHADAGLALLQALVKNTETETTAAAAKKVLAAMLLRLKRYEDAAAVLRDVTQGDTNDAVATAQLVVATSHFNADEAEQVAMRLPDASSGSHDVDVKALESLPPPKRKQVEAMKNNDGANGVKDEDNHDAAAKAAAARERKKKKKKKRLPKDYDPNGPAPDAERWLPKTLRSGYKKKKAKSENGFKGSQGADAAAAEVAAAKNAERSAAKAAASTASEGISAPPGGRAKARKKKNRR